MKKVAVIAGTPVDTRMGVEYIEGMNEVIGSQKCEPIYLPAAEDCDEQMKFQYSSDDEKRDKMNELFEEAISGDVQDFFIYCNSLSGAFDFDSYMEDKSCETGLDIRIYTPLQIYKKMGSEYSCVGVMAANNLSAHAIEEALMSSNPDIYVIGTGNMSIVRSIEEKKSPEEIVKACNLAAMCEYMEASGAEALILGCTHFPYLRDALSECTNLPLIDPAEYMLRELLQAR